MHFITGKSIILKRWPGSGNLFFGYEYIGLAKVRYLQLKNTYNALFKVNEPHLVETRDACLNYLKTQMDFLRKNYDDVFQVF